MIVCTLYCTDVLIKSILEGDDLDEHFHDQTREAAYFTEIIRDVIVKDNVEKAMGCRMMIGMKSDEQ